LRLGSLAAEAQAVIDPIVVKLAGEAVQRMPQSVDIDCSRLRSEPRYLVRELLMLAWRGQGWPEQGMGWAEWDFLAGMLIAPETAGARTLPGNVRAERVQGHLRLSRPGRPVDAA
jgi:hypothetical protein